MTETVKPVLVEVVNLPEQQAPQRAVRVSCQTYTIGAGIPTQICGYARSRRRVTIISADNTAFRLCYICSTQADTQAPGNPQGAAIYGGQVVQLETTDSLWAIAPTGNQATLGVIEEYDID